MSSTEGVARVERSRDVETAGSLQEITQSRVLLLHFRKLMLPQDDDTFHLRVLIQEAQAVAGVGITGSQRRAQDGMRFSTLGLVTGSAPMPETAQEFVDGACCWIVAIHTVSMLALSTRELFFTSIPGVLEVQIGVRFHQILEPVHTGLGIVSLGLVALRWKNGDGIGFQVVLTEGVSW